MITLHLPYPVSANRYLRHAKGRTYRSAEANAYRDNVGYACLLAKIRAPLAGLLMLRLVLHPVLPKDAVKREAKLGPSWWHEGIRCQDVDNIQKVAIDAMQGYVFGNDSQIRKIITEYGYPARDGGLTVEVAQWQPEVGDAH